MLRPGPARPIVPRPIAWVILLLLWALPAAAQIRLVPEPLRMTTGSGRLALRGAVTIAVPAGDIEAQFAADLLREEIHQATGATATIIHGATGTIVLTRDPALTEAGDEGYRIDVDARGARLRARSAAGLFYAVQTLRQLVRADGIAAVVVEDRPALRWRGVHDDVSRGPMPSIPALERRIALLAEFKVNLYSLYSENAIALRSHPLLATPGGTYTADEIRRLSVFAARHHVTLLLEPQTFSHLDRMLGFERYRGLAETPLGGSLSPVQPASYAYVDSLVAELAPLTESPFLHLGGDELSDLGVGASRDLVRRDGLDAVYLAHIARLRAAATRHGRRLLYWGDFAAAHPAILPRLPRDAVVALWDYKSTSGFDAQVEPFRAAGLDVFVCPGVSNWSRVFPNLDVALPNIAGLTAAGRRHGALGQLNCTWDDGGDALIGLCWYPLLFGAAAAWQHHDADPARFREAFDWAFFRATGDAAAVAVERLNAAHGVLRALRPTDATIEMSWLNPARGVLDQRLLAMLEPAAAGLRQAQEAAIEAVARARAASRRHGDQLDYLEFAARRLHALGTRAQMAKRLGDLYAEALQLPATGTTATAVDRLNSILGLLAQGRESTAFLRAEHERLWLAENRPYWLGNITALYDRDLQVWSIKADQVRERGVAFRNGTPLPAAEAMGFVK